MRWSQVAHLFLAATVASSSCWFGCTPSSGETAVRPAADEILAEADQQAWDAYYDEADSLYRLAAIEYKRLGDSRGVIIAQNGVAVQLREKGLYDSSLVLLDATVALARDEGIQDNALMNDLLQERGTTLIRLSRYEEAATLFSDLVDRRLVEEPIDSTDVGRAYHGLGWAYYEQQMASRAKEQFRIAINWYTDSRLGQFETSRSLNSLGSAYSERFEHDDAISQYKRSFELRSVLLRPNHPQLAIPLANLARELGTIGLLSEGIEKYHDAIGIFEQGLGQHHPQVAIGYGNLGTMVEDHGDLETAQIFLAHALDIRKRSLPAGHKFLIYSNMNLASLAFRRGEYNSAADYFESARVLLDSVHTSLHRLSVENDLLGAKVYLRLQNTRKSLELLRRARHRLSLYDVSEEQFLMANLAVADLYLRLGMAADAARVASDACANSGDSIGYGHYLLLECDYVLGLSRKALGSHLMAARHFSAVEDRFAEQTTNTFEFERKRIARDALGELSSYYQGEDR
ncbi:MAG: tetratricopeptide repeat protein, partial [Bacteroidetes bacterium]|nr:tetratricopeptide repeat protein [Bacteroidota bacterium]